jgi:predicted enzyme involved in methoxymalonyl-ACP biosynthesis
MENFVLNEIVSFVKENGFTLLKGEYIPTLKNDMVKEHYSDLGFTESDNFWILNTADYINRKTFINKNNYGKK